MKTNFSAETGEWLDTKGVTITVPKEGTMFAIDVLDGETTKLIKYFRSFINAFEERGYQDGVNMTACGYDWRHVPGEEWAKKCRGYIEKMVESSGKKAILVATSMGALNSYFLLRSAPEGWVEKYIFKYITPSPAWMGAPRAVDAMFTGVGDYVPSIIGNIFASLARTIPGVWFLLPWCDAFTDVPIAKTPEKTYFCDDVPNILAAQGIVDANLKYKYTRAAFSAYNNFDWMPNVPMITMYSTDLDTINTLVFNQELSHHDPDGDWQHPDYVRGPGDGTVPEVSLSYATNKWRKMYPERNITYVKLSKINHQEIVTKPEFINLMLDEAFHNY